MLSVGVGFAAVVCVVLSLLLLCLVLIADSCALTVCFAKLLVGELCESSPAVTRLTVYRRPQVRCADAQW